MASTRAGCRRGDLLVERTEHPAWAMWCEQGAKDALPDQPPKLAQGMGQKGPGSNRVEKLLHHLEQASFIPSFHLLLQQMSPHRSLAVVIQDIPAPLWTGTNQLHSWQKGRGNYISDAIKREAQYLHLKTEDLSLS